MIFILSVIVLHQFPLTDSHADGQDATCSLTLKEAVRLAFEQNLDVRAELFNPALAEADIRKNRAIYDPNLTLQTNYDESATTNPTQFSTNISKTKTFSLNAGISQLIPFGGTVGVTLNNNYERNNFSNSMDKYFTNYLVATFTQPLLKNFGQDATELSINVATFGKEASLNQFQTKLADIISQVRTEYFRLYYLREDLEVKKTSRALAQKILDETNARVIAGVLPAMEILNAEYNVSTREKEVIDAERALSDKQDLLRTLIQLPGNARINPADAPYVAAYTISESDAVRQAMASRPELKKLREDLHSAELQEKVAASRVMPDLSLNANAGLSGIDKSYAKQWEVLARGDYPVWGIGFTFTYPLGNTAAENDYIKTHLKAEQLRTQIKSQEETISNEVRNATRAVRSGYKQLDVTTRGAAYAEEVLNAYIKKARVGLATTKDVFDVQTNLVTAKGAQISARTSYDGALTQYWKTTGEILAREGIAINGKNADTLYGTASR